MAKKDKSIKTVAGLVFKCVWLFIALIVFFHGLTMFLSYGEDEKFSGWLIWGGICCIPIIFEVIKDIFSGLKSGWAQGANDYTATIDSSSVTVENHPFMGAIVGLIGSIFCCVLIGPIFLGFKIIQAIFLILPFVISLISKKKKQNKGE